MNAAPYFGNAPYCYTNTLLTALNRPDLTPGTLETLTGSPFGFQLLFGKLPLFDPLGWDPNLGLDQALTLLGYTWETCTFANAREALAVLQAELQRGPVFVGPLDMGFLKHQPESGRASGADHFVTVLEIAGNLVYLHDPQGHPWAALPQELFMQAWRAEHVGYVEAFTLRRGFRQVNRTDVEDALTASLPLAAQWLRGRADLPVPPGTLGGAAGLESLAQQVESGLTDDLRAVLINFSLRVGARRKADAAQALAAIGVADAAALLHQQARTLGGLQYFAVQGNAAALVQGFRTLAEQHNELAALLSR